MQKGDTKFLPVIRIVCWSPPFGIPVRNSHTAVFTYRSLQRLLSRQRRFSQTRLLPSMAIDPKRCFQLFRESVPPLNSMSYKGQAGKIAVIGGSLEYTGAPYFAAMSAMRAGAELCFVYCHEYAAPAIKAYSPDLIVYPGFHFLGTQCESLSRMHALVLGPGLGRDESARRVVEDVIQYAVEKRKPLVIDADALWFISQEQYLRELIRDAPEGFLAYMTPNKVELHRMETSWKLGGSAEIAKWFKGRIVLVQKGSVDAIFGIDKHIGVSTPGSLKRVGGQGDFLAGLIALFASWMINSVETKHLQLSSEIPVAAAFCACSFTREAARLAFEKHGRGLLASDILPFIEPAIDKVLRERTVHT